jgi:hypothetical protein
VLLALGTWIPVAGAIIGAVMAVRISDSAVLIGGSAGLVLSGALFAVLYFRGAKLIEA